ncbi:rhomboid family intramembrane serine protease [Spirochaeta cellobiosiphila]|uniref:rhomboid family intramembrane serine protease n=1 Tax=Spirochaeta cellobiosiphila TaxID=504483 RepID=UPI000415CF2C|nr:rhomboid family intramembrane serine protease [Spirochaeta cellobiosiphila]
MNLKYNAPVTMTFGILCALVMALDLYVFPGLGMNYFLAPGQDFDSQSVWNYFGLVFHIFAHDSWDHLLQNFLYILLLGPVLEEKYGSKTLAVFIFITALFTGILNVLLMQPTHILGASGIVFMMILLVSFAGIKKGEIPITLIVIALLYPVKEIAVAIQNPDDGVSLTAHIAGGISGTLFGFVKHLESSKGRKKKEESPSEATIVN